MKQFAVTLLLAMVCCAQGMAQAFLDDLKSAKQGEGKVTVTQSKEIDELVNNAKLVRQTPPPTPQQHTNGQVSHNTVRHQTEHSNAAAAHNPERHDQQKAHRDKDGDSLKQRNDADRLTETETDIPVNTTRKVMRNSRKVTGYRVQAYSGGNSRADRQRAENIGNAIKLKYPELPVYVHFYSPRWICRVGNFRTYEQAASVLKDVKRMGYRQACIVKGKITVAY